MLRGADPRENTEAVGDDDPVKTTGYGIKNIKRLVPMLMPATTSATDDNADLKELYPAPVRASGAPNSVTWRS